MQTRAIIEAAVEVKQEKGFDIIPEIMIPLVGMESEIADVKATVEKTIGTCLGEYGVEMEYLIGTMRCV